MKYEQRIRHQYPSVHNPMDVQPEIMHTSYKIAICADILSKVRCCMFKPLTGVRRRSHSSLLVDSTCVSSRCCHLTFCRSKQAQVLPRDMPNSDYGTQCNEAYNLQRGCTNVVTCGGIDGRSCIVSPETFRGYVRTKSAM